MERCSLPRAHPPQSLGADESGDSWGTGPDMDRENHMHQHQKTSSPAGVSRRGLFSAVAVIGSGAALAPLMRPVAAAAAAVVQGTEAPTGKLGLSGTVVARHRNIFRSFTLTSSNGIGVIAVGQNRYAVTFNAGDGLDTVQIFNADTGVLHYQASTPAKVGGNFVHDGQGNLYFSVGKLVMHLSVPDKTIRQLASVQGGITDLYDFQLDYKGRLWAGTYPTGVVICLERATGREITRTPRLGTGNHYARGLSISPDRKTVWAGTGTADPDLFRIDVDAPPSPRRVGIPGVGKNSTVSRTAARGRKVFVWHNGSTGKEILSVYDTVTRTWTPSPTSFVGRSMSETDAAGYVYVNAWGVLRRMRPGDADMKAENVATVSEKSLVHLGIAGSHLYLFTEAPSVLRATKITTAGAPAGSVSYRVVPVPLVTQSMVIDPRTNTLFSGGYRGDGLCSTNLATGAFAHSATASGIEQIEGMVVDGEKLYVGSYISSVIVEHRTNRGVTDSASYRTLARLGPSHRQSRPFGWAVTTSHVVFGTVPEPGYRGGALGTIERSTGKVTVYNKIVPELSIVGLAAAGDIVYGCTSARAGYGADDYEGASVVFAAEARTGAVRWRRALPGTSENYGPVLMGSFLYVGTLDTVVELRASDGRVMRTFVLDEGRSERPAWQNVELVRIPGTTRLAHLAWGTVTVLDIATGQYGRVLAKAHKHMSFDSTGALWVTTGNDVVKLRLDAVNTSGAIGAKYAAMGGAPILGYPEGPQLAVATNSGIMQRFFRNGKATSIYSSSSTGTHAVETSSAIGKKFVGLGKEDRGYGLPSTDAVRFSGGAYQVFNNAGRTTRVVTTTQYGTFSIEEYWGIGKAWVAAGRDTAWGWPIEDEHAVGSEYVQRFSKNVTAHRVPGKSVWITK